MVLVHEDPRDAHKVDKCFDNNRNTWCQNISNAIGNTLTVTLDDTYEIHSIVTKFFRFLIR